MKKTNIPRTSLFVLLSALCVFCAAVQPSSADYSTSGTVGGPYPYTYTIKCNPGDSFSVSVGSDYPTSVDILFMTPSGNEWAQNSVAGSDQRNIPRAELHRTLRNLPITQPTITTRSAPSRSTDKLTRFR